MRFGMYSGRERIEQRRIGGLGEGLGKLKVKRVWNGEEGME